MTAAAAAMRGGGRRAGEGGEEEEAAMRQAGGRTGYMMVSEVGRIAMGSCRSEEPDLVTHATSALNPSTCSFSFSSACASEGQV